MLAVITHHSCHLLVEHTFALSEDYEEYVEDGIDDQGNKETVLSTIVSHEESIDAQLYRIDEHERSGIEGEE